MTSIPLSSLEPSPGGKFAAIGDRHSGRIIDIGERQQTSIDGALLTWADGSPRMQWVITLATDAGDNVALYAKGGNYTATEGTGDSMLKAIAKAAGAAGATAIEVGAELAVAYTGTADLGGGKRAKLYTAAYKLPAPAGIPVDDLFS